MPVLQASGSACSPGKTCLLLCASILAIYILGPPLYWHFFEGIAVLKHGSRSECAPCNCDCSVDSASVLPPGFTNNQSADCVNADPSMRQELGTYTADLLSEELKLQAAVAEDDQRRADSALLEAKKLSSQYQKEAEKCNFGMETCEEAREKAEEALIEQKKISEKWEKRARDLGWTSD
ncbi:hypothetical protein L7F22_051046 [Adiantum nelumboides]|nr:hypothetical protein [Adiantum nelumboides]